MTLNIVRLVQPDIGDYQEASRVAAEQWPETKSINRRERFAAFRELGVELVLAYENQVLKGVAFLLPDKYETGAEEHHFVWLFRVFSRPEAKNLGALMLIKTMHWYPAILGIGITPVAAKLYQTLRWQKYEPVWRCVHPISLTRMVERYADRLEAAWKKRLLKIAGRGYDFINSMVELLVNPSYSLKRFGPGPRLPLERQPINPSIERKLSIISTYLTLDKITRGNQVLEAFEITGIGRIVRDDFHGLKRLLAHLKLWRELRKENVTFIEYLVTSESAKRQAYFHGYVPLRMPIYYWDKHKNLAGYFLDLPNYNFNFVSCDKLL